MLAASEQRFGPELPEQPIEWLSDNGSAYIALEHAASPMTCI
jgi:hypothetical protein